MALVNLEQLRTNIIATLTGGIVLPDGTAEN